MEKRKLINTFNSAYNPSILAGMCNGKRALIIESAIDLPGNITDFFGVIIAAPQTTSVPPDITLYNNPTPLINYQIDGDLLNAKSLLCINWECRKFMPDQTNSYQIWFAPVAATTTINPATFEGISFGLSDTQPGLHLAKILGCTEFWCTSPSQSANLATSKTILDFTSQKTGMRFTNFAGKRLSLLQSL